MVYNLDPGPLESSGTVPGLPCVPQMGGHIAGSECNCPQVGTVMLHLCPSACAQKLNKQALLRQRELVGYGRGHLQSYDAL